jgi:hypothetical protein
MTQFTHTRVTLLPGITVVIDGNSKITAGNGTFSRPSPNALSLPAASVHGATPFCPGSTATCRASCYVKGLAENAPEVYAAYHENEAALRAILDPKGGRIAQSAHALGMWIADHCLGGFRWHVSGDVQSVDHAVWIARTCEESAAVRHWIYTRTLGDAVRELSRARNLAVNVSADRENWQEARACAGKYGARICYVATSPDDLRAIAPLLPDGSVIFPDYPLRGRDLVQLGRDPTEHDTWIGADHRTRSMICPADFFGQSESARCGPCDKCLKPSRGSRAW